MLNVNDWRLWLNSNETRTMLSMIQEAVSELKEMVTDGSHILEKQTGKIALDYTYSLGQLDGMRTIINMIETVNDEE